MRRRRTECLVGMVLLFGVALWSKSADVMLTSWAWQLTQQVPVTVEVPTEFSLRSGTPDLPVPTRYQLSTGSLTSPPLGGGTRGGKSTKSLSAFYNLYPENTNGARSLRFDFHSAGTSPRSDIEGMFHFMDRDDFDVITIIMPLDRIIPQAGDLSFKILGRDQGHRWFGLLGTW